MATKYLVYEAFAPPYKQPEWKAVDASGERGLMVGIAPKSRVYSWWAEDAQAAVNMVKKFQGSWLIP